MRDHSRTIVNGELHAQGIKDCDVGAPSLCVYGADFVRSNTDNILNLYEDYANQTAVWLGRDAQVCSSMLSIASLTRIGLPHVTSGSSRWTGAGATKSIPSRISGHLT